MHISTANISKMVTDKVNIAISIKNRVTYGFWISIFRFGHGPKEISDFLSD